MKFTRPIAALTAAATIAIMPVASAFAQRQQPSPEQRIDRLERQVDDMQKRVYPKGRPAATAGFPDDPAATQSAVISLDQRLDALERQMTDLVRQSEENTSRTRTLESTVQQMRTDSDQRIAALEQRIAAAPVAAPVDSAPAPAPAAPGAGKGKPTTPKPATTGSAVPAGDAGATTTAAVTDPAEEAYSEGFRLWQAGQLDDAIRSLRSFVAAYPKHRRTSYANNLIGRALLDKGQPREAATGFIANYRGNPSGERAQDSLYYLGQALMKLGQPTQACNAYAELDSIYGSKIRPEVKKLETDAKAQANCS